MGSGALAATSGHLPLVSNEVFGGEAVDGEASANHGEDVSAVAGDKDAVGTKTNPDGKVIENHGQAVNEAAHDKTVNSPDSANPVNEVPGNGNPPDDNDTGGTGRPAENENGNTGGNDDSNSGGNGNGNSGGNGDSNSGGNGDSNSGGNGDNNSGGNGNGHADNNSSGNEDDDED
jgi:hypothetical protein